MSTKEVNTGGRLTLKEQAAMDHEKAEIRIDLAMAKAVPKVIKKLLAMVDNMGNQKENTNLGIIDRVLGHNKETRKAARELLKAVGNDSMIDEDDYTMSISLTSSDEPSKTLN